MMTTPLSATVRGARIPFTRAVVVLLTLAALVVSLFALHSMSGGSADATAPAGSHSHANSAAGPTDALVAQSGVGMTVGTMVSGVTGVPVMPCEGSCAMECAVMAATCAIVFILAALLLLVRFPAMHSLVLDAGPRLRALAPRAQFHVYFPSLTVLSISRT